MSDILPEDVEEKVKEAAEISMGTEITEDDINNIQQLCDQVSLLRETEDGAFIFNIKVLFNIKYS